MRARCGTENGAREADGEDNLGQGCLPVGDTRAWFGRAEHAELAVDGPEKETGEGCAGELSEDVAWNAAPGKVFAQGKGECDGGAEAGAGDVTHEEDDRHHHQTGCRDRRWTADQTAADRIDDRRACCHEHQQKRPKEFREQAPRFQRRIVGTREARELESEPCVASTHRSGKIGDAARNISVLVEVIAGADPVVAVGDDQR